MTLLIAIIEPLSHEIAVFQGLTDSLCAVLWTEIFVHPYICLYKYYINHVLPPLERYDNYHECGECDIVDLCPA